jgi:hypothetical protein
MGTYNYVTGINIVGFTILYIICFVYIFKKENEISSFILLLIYHIFFLCFIIQSIYNYITSGSVNNLRNYNWFGLFVGGLFNMVSLILFLITYNHLYKEYDLDGEDTIQLSIYYEKHILLFKKLFIVAIGLMMLLLLTANYSTIHLLNPMTILNGVLSTSIIAISSYELYWSNNISKLNNRRVITKIK